MTPHLTTALSSAGWAPSRTANISHAIGSLEKNGVHCHEAARRVLESFNGIVFDESTGTSNPTSMCRIDAAKAMATLWPAWLHAYEQATGQRLVPVGECYNLNGTLLVAENGSVYCAYEECLEKLGSDWCDGLEALMSACDRSRYPTVRLRIEWPSS